MHGLEGEICSWSMQGQEEEGGEEEEKEKRRGGREKERGRQKLVGAGEKGGNWHVARELSAS